MQIKFAEVLVRADEDFASHSVFCCGALQRSLRVSQRETVLASSWFRRGITCDPKVDVLHEALRAITHVVGFGQRDVG